MPVLRYLYILALVVWLGGMLVAGLVVAPSLFGALEAHDPDTGRAAAGVAMVTSLTLQRLLGPRPVSYGIRAGLIAGMLALFAYTGFAVNPRVEALQREVDGPMARLDATDPRRAEFDGLHRLSTVLLGVAAAGGLVLMAWEARE
jgi:hypothetical protein